MAFPSSSALFPVSTFASGSAQDDLRQFLQNTIQQQFSKDPADRKFNVEDGAWRPFIASAVDTFIATFPSPSESLWPALHEKIAITAMLVDAVELGATHVDGLLLNHNALARRITGRLLILCYTLELWTYSDVPHQEGVLRPDELSEKAQRALVALLRSLGGPAITSIDSEQPNWVVLKGMIADLLDECHTITNSPPLMILPLSIRPFENARLLQAADPLHPTVDSAPPVSINIDSASNLPVFVSLCLFVISQTLSSSLSSHWFLITLARRTAELCQDAYYASSIVSHSVERRTRCMARNAMAASNLCTVLPAVEVAVESMVQDLVIRRVKDGRDEQGSGPLLKDLASRRHDSSRQLQMETELVLSALRAAGEGSSQAAVDLSITYVQHRIHRLPIPVLRSAVNLFHQCSFSPSSAASLNALVDYLRSVTPGSEAPVVEQGQPWVSRVREHTANVVAPDDLDWMDEGPEGATAAVVARVLQAVESRFHTPLASSSAEDRTALARCLSALILLLQEHPRSDEQEELEPIRLPLLPSFTTALSRLVDGAENEITPSVRAETYRLLGSIIRHDDLQWSPHSREYIARLLHNGLSDPNRSVRLTAGRTLAVLCERRCETAERPDMFLTPHLTFLRHLLTSQTAGIRESSVLSLGFMGKVASEEVLGEVVVGLISQLGSHNLLIRGTASNQLTTLAKSRGKSPYHLLQPYMAKVAPFIVSRLVTEPHMLRETCQLLTMGAAGFLSLTLLHTLPGLFAACNRPVVDKIAVTIGETPSALLLKQVHEVLAHAYLLPDPQRTTSALQFVVETLAIDAGNDQIQLDILIKSCAVNLLTPLVIATGDDRPERQAAAIRALERIADSLALRSQARERAGTTARPLLVKYMRGLITHVTETLQDFRGKQAAESKRPILRALTWMIACVGSQITSVAPQIMACVQALLAIPELTEGTLTTWLTLLKTLSPADAGSYVGVTTANVLVNWSSFSADARRAAKECVEYLVCQIGGQLGEHLDDAADLNQIKELREANSAIHIARSKWPWTWKLQVIARRTYSYNHAVALQALNELKLFLIGRPRQLETISSGDMFDPLLGEIMAALYSASSRDEVGAEAVRSLAFECMGIVGAVDPDRYEVHRDDPQYVVQNNFVEEEEACSFAMHLITNVLVGTFRSTSDIQHQGHVAYAIQELLRFCDFQPAIVEGRSVPVKLRKRWQMFPKDVLEVVTPLLDAGYKLPPQQRPATSHPIYPTQTTYRVWMQTWAAHLIAKVQGAYAARIFAIFDGVVRQRDAGIAHFLLPHLVLNVLISGDADEAKNVRLEILAVLEDQVKADSDSTPEKKMLSSQAIFMLLDHLSSWVRTTRQTQGARTQVVSRRGRRDETSEHLMRVDSVLTNINRDLMARAALQCKAYALALMNFEQQILAMRTRRPVPDAEIQESYDRLHEIYASLDEPDGMEGVSILVVSPSLEHQIRQHESTGRWTSAQSCWEVRLQQSPGVLEYHIGLLRCLRNLGHYDTLRTHVKGVLTRNPEWEAALAGFQVESSWMIGDWADVRSIVNQTQAQVPQVTIARLLLCMQQDDQKAIGTALNEARMLLGASISASGLRGHRQSHDALVDLHLVRELEFIHGASHQPRSKDYFGKLSKILEHRLDLTLPTFRNRERILSLRRTAFLLSPTNHFEKDILSSWLMTAKMARKAGHWQTAYSATLQARQNGDLSTQIQSAKLVKAMGEPHRALQELEGSLRLFGVVGTDVIDMAEEEEDKKVKAKALLLRARWMQESDRFDPDTIGKEFTKASDQHEWESGLYRLARYQDDFQETLKDDPARRARLTHRVICGYLKAIKTGSKYVYQTVPRVLTLWLDMGEAAQSGDVASTFIMVHDEMVNGAMGISPLKWYIAFPQLVSRITHKNADVWTVLRNIYTAVIQEHPQQALWMFASTIKSTDPERSKRGNKILSRVQTATANADKPATAAIPALIKECIGMVEALLELCDRPVADERRISMKKDFPRLHKLAPTRLIIPLQESLTARLSTTSAIVGDYQPFPVDAPVFHQWADEIELMKSLAKPRKVTIYGSNGNTYMYLGKPKDDLRKDARLMDFNGVINKLLKANSDSRRRQLHIRTYGVVTLNEECGFVQWVPHTIPVRPILLKLYDLHGVKSWGNELADVFDRVKKAPAEAGKLFESKVLREFPPVFHEWFLETFPEPSTWLASRLSYGRTAAVMSMVGFILGLGDRHLENILMDTNTGDVVHVDFNCLFEKGLQLETPERVPFRLTQNIVDGMGVTGVEGVFRIACELTMQLLRDNKDTLMSILDAFIHDPLVEWRDEKRRQDQQRERRERTRGMQHGGANGLRQSIDMRGVAKNALAPIERKLKGIHASNLASINKESGANPNKELGTAHLVQVLIQEATDTHNLGRMYPGWAPWH